MSGEISINCSNCAKTLNVIPSDVERIMKCNYCSTFLKIPAKKSKRVEIPCPSCDTSLNVPSKIRGKVCSCWSCGKDVLIPNISELSITDVSVPQYIQQGENSCKLLLCVKNSGMSAVITGINIGFESQQNDLSAFFKINNINGSSSLVKENETTKIECSFEVAENAPAGPLNVHVKISGEDALDNSSVFVETTIQSSVGYNRVFAVQTENELKETAGVPFAVQLWACLESGDVDTSFEGKYVIDFYIANRPESHSPKAEYPLKVEMEFYEGVATSDREFILYDALDTPQIAVSEKQYGVGEGYTDHIQVLPSAFFGFAIQLTSPQMNGCLFQGQNQLYAIDEYENTVFNFNENIKIEAKNGKGKIQSKTLSSSLLPATSFKNGIMDLNQFQLIYTAEQENLLPFEEFFSFSFEDKEIVSAPIIIENNPLEIFIEKIETPPCTEQGLSFTTKVHVFNASSSNTTISKISLDFYLKNEHANNFFDISIAETGTKQLYAASRNVLDFEIAVHEDTPFGSYNIEFTIEVTDTSEVLRNKRKQVFHLDVESAGRILEIAHPEEGRVVAGTNISLQFICFLGEQVDKLYKGKKRLFFESDASPSVNGSESFIPSFIDVDFHEGIGKTSNQLFFTNAQDNPTLRVSDRAPGGCSGEITFEVIANTLASFWFVLEKSQTNRQAFAGKNFVMAMDAYGNLDATFCENCEIYPLSGKGKVVFGDEVSIIPSYAFKSGIADLTEIEMAYFTDVAEKLPKEEQFSIIFGDIVGRSEIISILPKSAELVINRITAPEKVDRNSNYQVSVEIENIGNKPASVSTILFNFQNKGDVSSHYTVTPLSDKTESLFPFVPFLATFNIKTNSQAAAGMTGIEITVAGTDIQDNIPLRISDITQWIVEEKERSFVLTTQNNNEEVAGTPFFIKIEAHRDEVKDSELEGTVKFICDTNATKSKSGVNANIPQNITVQFKNGEAITQPLFCLTNANELPTIYFRTPDGKTYTSTSRINIKQNKLHHFDFRIAPNIRAGEPLLGENMIYAFDEYGNLVRDFQEDFELSLQNVDGQIYNVTNKAISVIEGGSFQEGILNLTNLQIKVECNSSQALPSRAQFLAVYDSKKFKSKEFQILARPINLHIDEIIFPSQVFWTNDYIVEIKIRNEGKDIKLTSANFKFENNSSLENNYKISPIEENLETIPKGIIILKYNVSIPEGISEGTTDCSVTLGFCDESNKEVSCQRSFRWFVNASGRIFVIALPPKIVAGLPFAISVTAERNKEKDTNYEGIKKLAFKSNANPAPNGKEPDIPTDLDIEFIQGCAKTEEIFSFQNANEQVVIEVEEKQGNTSGLSGTIEIRPSDLGGFYIQLHSPQINQNKFIGENILVAKDVFENIKYDFHDSVQIRTQSGKGEIHLPQHDMVNTVPNLFQNGKIDLTNLEMVYQGNVNDVLPKTDQFIVSYKDKQGQSNPITIEPRPANIQLDNIKFQEKAYQGDLVCPLSFEIVNNSDQSLEFTNILISFIHSESDEDISSQFSLIPHPNNPKLLTRGNNSNYTFHIDIDGHATIGEIKVIIEANVTEPEQDIQITAQTERVFSLTEKPRTFIIKTEHDNMEKVGEQFYLVLCAYKDGQLDISYNGVHKIYFSSSASAIGSHSPRIPEFESVEFKQGIAKTSRNFMFVKASQKPVITATEKGKAEGTSEDIVLNSGSIQSIQISFEQSGNNPYTLKPLDHYGNILNQQFLIDDDVKIGVILSGSQGNYYEILDLIGHGAMGKVYRAKRLNDNVIVAIKSTMFNALSDINRFILEAVMLIQFSHENIVKGYDVRQLCTIEKGKPQLKFYMVMEFLTGQSVKSIIDNSRDGILSPVHATKIILHTARALVYMWERKTIHRDIKPENIQITKDDKIKLLDLGIARAEGGMTDIAITRDDTIVGSYPYISPERLKSSAVDYRADVYSLGATYYHMLTGMPPYLDTYKGRGGKDLLEYLVRIRTKRMPTPPEKLESRIPVSVSNVIMTMLSIKSTRRYNSAEELNTVLENLYKEIQNS